MKAGSADENETEEAEEVNGADAKTEAEEKCDEANQGEENQGASSIIGVFEVATKTEDGGSRATNTDGSDAFSRFSNRNIRMRYLLGLGGTDVENQDNQDWMEITGYQEGLERRRADTEPDGTARESKSEANVDAHVETCWYNTVSNKCDHVIDFGEQLGSQRSFMTVLSAR